ALRGRRRIDDGVVRRAGRVGVVGEGAGSVRPERAGAPADFNHDGRSGPPGNGGVENGSGEREVHLRKTRTTKTGRRTGKETPPRGRRAGSLRGPCRWPCAPNLPLPSASSAPASRCSRSASSR